MIILLKSFLNYILNIFNLVTEKILLLKNFILNIVIIIYPYLPEVDAITKAAYVKI